MALSRRQATIWTYIDYFTDEYMRHSASMESSKHQLTMAVSFHLHSYLNVLDGVYLLRFFFSAEPYLDWRATRR